MGLESRDVVSIALVWDKKSKVEDPRARQEGDEVGSMSNHGMALPFKSSRSPQLRYTDVDFVSQGCCQSRDESPYDDHPPPGTQNISSSNATRLHPHNSSSSAAINQQHSSSNLNVSDRGSSILPPPETSRPNQPIRAPSPLPTSPSHLPHRPPPWTRSQLSLEREAFFDTRVSGDPEVWKALRVVCEEVRRGELEEAQAILDALNMTCPNGRIVGGRGRRREKGGLYDERGELYDIPAWVVVDPGDVVDDGDEKGVVVDEDKSGVGEEEGKEPAGVSTPRREEKGKGRAEDPGEIVQLRLRLSDRGTDVVVSIGMKQKISDAVRSVREQIGEKRVRLMYLGRPLDERVSLAESGWVQGHVINAMVFEGEESMLRGKKR